MLDTPAPEFRWPDTTGQIASLSHYRGKIVLLDFWATWCDSCVEELPSLKRLHAVYQPRGVELLGASVEHADLKTVLTFTHQHKVPWRVLIANPDDIRTYDVLGLPTKYLIDSKGTIVKRYVGWTDTAQLERDIRFLIGKESAEAVGMKPSQEKVNPPQT